MQLVVNIKSAHSEVKIEDVERLSVTRKEKKMFMPGRDKIRSSWNRSFGASLADAAHVLHPQRRAFDMLRCIIKRGLVHIGCIYSIHHGQSWARPAFSNP